jgi:tRNA pseudouridine38-40 synthase
MTGVRLRLDLSYDGSGFSGWARQPELRTVQGELETALATVLRLPGVAVTCAGRTDTGVHARGQVVHLDVEDEPLEAVARRGTDPPVEALVRRLNRLLPDDVRIRDGRVAAEGFDARFSALWRRYGYRISDARSTADPLLRHHVLSWPRTLDETPMNVAATALLGVHDFAAFCRPREGATTVRELLELRWQRSPDGVLGATVRADAFCHHMVRAVVGCLVAVGEGRRTPDWPAQLLAAGERDSSVLLVPAHGLTLEEVAYPPDGQLAERVAKTRVVRRG